MDFIIGQASVLAGAADLYLNMTPHPLSNLPVKEEKEMSSLRKRGKCLRHPSTFHRGAQNTHTIKTEERGGHLQRKACMNRWTGPRVSYIYYGEAYYKAKGHSFYLERRKRELFLAFTS